MSRRIHKQPPQPRLLRRILPNSRNIRNWDFLTRLHLLQQRQDSRVLEFRDHALLRKDVQVDEVLALDDVLAAVPADDLLGVKPEIEHPDHGNSFVGEVDDACLRFFEGAVEGGGEVPRVAAKQAFVDAELDLFGPDVEVDDAVV